MHVQIAECAPVERSRRSALFKTLDSSSKIRELNERLIQLEGKVSLERLHVFCSRQLTKAFHAYPPCWFIIITLHIQINTCIFNGKRYGAGESWKLADCIQCSCTVSSVFCC